jgi:hypothetical protein
MNTTKIALSALTLALSFGTSAIAQGMSKNDYKAAKQKISAEYTSAKTACGSLSGNAKDICVEEAKGKESVAKAELQASYKPSLQARYKVQVASAHAGYAVAKERCDDSAGNVKDVCVKEAKAAQTVAVTDAEVQLKTAQANRVANAKTSDAVNQAVSTKADVRNDAAAQKREAQYKVEKEKCDALASAAKDGCLTQAKANFGKL